MTSKTLTHRQKMVLSGATLNMISRFAFTSLMVIHLAKEGMQPSDIGLIALIYHFTLRGLGPVFGIIVDRYSAGRCFVAGLFISSFGFFLCSLQQLNWWFGYKASLLALGIGLSATATEALLVMDTGSKNQGNRALVILYIMINVAASVGPLLASLALAIGAQTAQVYTVAGLLSLVCGFTFLFHRFDQAMAESYDVGGGLKSAFNNREFRVLLACLPPVWMLFCLMHTTVPIYLIESAGISDSLIVQMFTLNALIAIILGYPINRILVRQCRKKGRSNMDGLALGSILMGIALFTLYFSGLAPVLRIILFSSVFTLGELCFIPMIEILVNETRPQASSPGSYFGLASLAYGIGSGVSNYAGGYLVQWCRDAGFGFFPLSLGSFAMLVGVMYWMISNRSLSRKYCSLTDCR